MALSYSLRDGEGEEEEMEDEEEQEGKAEDMNKDEFHMGIARESSISGQDQQ